MKKFFTLLSAFGLFVIKGNSQVVLNELYTDPGSGNHEFFEIYNTNPSAAGLSTDNLTLVTFFDISGSKGFYVMDLPNMTIAPRGYFVGAAALPFNYQGTTNSTAADFNWNSASFPANNGYLKKWVQGTANLLDGNLFYDQGSIPANFNDFLFRRTGSGASYSVFLYKDGELINTFIGGTGGSATVLTAIVNMPQLYVNMTSTAPDFTINFSGYGSLPAENCVSDAGSDNGYIREFDGACASWKKSSSQVMHTPKASNGTLIGYTTGSVSIEAAISVGTPALGSTLNNDIIAAPTNYFPIELQIFTDLGSNPGVLDATDVYVQTNSETTVNDGAFYTKFFPYNASILIAAKTSAGCFDKILFIPNSIVLSVSQVTAFNGNRYNDDIHLSWSVEQNESAYSFELQKSTDGLNFSTAALIFSTENKGQQTYTYNTSAPVSGTVVYRLRIVNKNNVTAYSKILSFTTNRDIRKSFSIINNPVVDKLTLNYRASNNQVVDIRVFDMTGRLVQHTKTNVVTGNNNILIPLAAHTSSGIYTVNLADGDRHYTEKFIR